LPSPWGPNQWKWGGFDLKYNVTSHGTDLSGPKIWRDDAIRLPYWFLALVPLVFTLLGARRIQQARRIRWRVEHGLCPRCGYDLRATPERCPECGQSAGRSGCAAWHFDRIG
jgi:hypothetical protein